MLLALAALCLVLVYAVMCRSSRARGCFAHLPTYPQLPLIGSAHHLYGDGRHIFRRLVEISEISEECGLPFVVWMGPSHPCLVLMDLDDIKTVTNKFLERPYYYNFARVWLGDGLLTAPVPTWKHNIRKLAGIFSKSSLVDGFQEVFNTHARELVQKLKAEVDRPPFDALEKYLAETTLATICQIALGVPMITDSVVTREYCSAFSKAIEILQIRGFNFFLHSDLLFGLTPYKKHIEKAVEKLHEISETALRISLKGQKSKNINGDNNAEKTTDKFKSYLDVLLQLHANDPSFTTQQVKDEIDTIILGGQETVATTISYALLMIGCKLEVQDKLYGEMREIFGDSKREVTSADLSRMVYCDAVVSETLRLYPPGPGVMRVADRDLQLKSCTVPKGTYCVVNIFGVGRSKRCWGPDAHEFRPERWLAGQPPPAAHLAFSTGKRACIGKKYAIAMMKTVIAYCVRELALRSEAEKMLLKVEITLRPAGGHLLGVRLRPG